MNATEFVKKLGLLEAKRVLHDARGCVGVKLWGRYEFSTDELNRLVESHDLVEKHGGLESAKKELQRQSILRWINPETERLRGAIADVESCL